MNEGISLIQIEKSRAPRIEPWGTPYLIDLTLDVAAFTHTICSLFVRTDVTRVRVAVGRPYNANFRTRRQ